MSRQCVVADSVTAFDRSEWNGCFPGELENWDYYRSVEEAGLADFSWRYLAVTENGRLLAAVPAFKTVYELDTTAQDVVKRLLDIVTRIWPKLLSIPLLCLGSPVTETCQIGFAPSASEVDKQSLLSMLIVRFRQLAGEEGIRLLAVKDAREYDKALWQPALAGFARMAGLPTATLPVPFRDLDGYFKTLSRATRKDMKRKMRGSPDIRIESRSAIDDVIGRIANLYEETLTRSDLQFERLPPQYFSAVLRNMPGQARCVLYWKADELLAFNLMLESSDRLVDKFVGTGKAARDHNLYFLSWMENVRYCIANGIPVYQSGQAGYQTKVRLGSQLAVNWNYFLHTNPLLNALLRIVARLVRLDRFDPEIRVAIHGIK
jgi:predicted N-acyltransferase